MYDYLAKIILLGPSGTGKSVLCASAHYFLSPEATDFLTAQTIFPGPASYIVSSRMNGESSRRKPSGLSSRARSSKWALVPGGRG